MRKVFGTTFLFVSALLLKAQCADANGNFVQYIPNTNINDVAQARLLPNGAPVVFYNPNILSWLSPATRLFFQYHECAHHVLGHALGNINPMMEQQADCLAIRTLVGNGQINQYGLAMIQADIARFGVADWSHLPGPQRAFNLQACLQ